MAKVLLREFEQFRLMFIEGPVSPEELDGFRPQLAAPPRRSRSASTSTQGHRWRNPVWRHADGFVAEW